MTLSNRSLVENYLRRYGRTSVEWRQGGGPPIVIEPVPPEEDFVLRATRLLTDDQIKQLPTTPLEVVPAPGTGKYNFPISCIIETDFHFGVYTNIGDSTLNIGATDFVVTVGENIANMFRAISYNMLSPIHSQRTVNVCEPTQPTFPRAADTDDTWGNSFGFLFNGFDHLENMHWTIAADNSLGDLTGGHSSNWMLVKIYYTIETWHQEAVS